MDQTRRGWLSLQVLAVAGLACSATAVRAAVPSERVVPAPGACPFCRPGQVCEQHVS